jgi:hypothetical protein
MFVTSIDSENNLFRVEPAVSVELAALVMATDWMSLPWQPQEGQENWARRRITDTAIPWIDQWHQEISSQWSYIEQQVGRKLHSYFGTAWWVDEPGFTCGTARAQLFTGTRIPQLCAIKHLRSPTLATS